MVGAFEGLAWIIVPGLVGATVWTATRENQLIGMKTVLLLLLGFFVVCGTFAAGAGAGAFWMSRRMNAEYLTIRNQMHKAMRAETEEIARAHVIEQQLRELTEEAGQ